VVSLFTGRRRRLGRGALSLLVPGALALAVAGCGLPHLGGSGTSTGAKTGRLAFAACMRAHGISDYPDPTGNATSFTQVNGQVTINGVALKETEAQVQSARQACATATGAGAGNTPPNPQSKSAALAYARCMRSHGVPNFPDPTFNNGGIQFADHGGYDPNSQTFHAADAACQSALTAAVSAAQNG